MMRERLLSGLSRRDWSEHGEFAEVLDGGGEMELVLSSVWSSEAKAVEADDAFKVGEEHLNLLSGVA